MTFAANISPHKCHKVVNHTLFVCKTCASGESGGEKFLQQLQHLAQNWELQGEFPIEAVECMSACNRSCVIAFTGKGKLTYLFGDLGIDDSAFAVLECAKQYYHHPDGVLPWAKRPVALKNGILARIPAV